MYLTPDDEEYLMPRSSYLARQRGKTPAAELPLEKLASADTAELLAALEDSTDQVNQGKRARRVRDAVLRALLHKPRSEVSIERLMDITGYQRAMVYRYRSAGDDIPDTE